MRKLSLVIASSVMMAVVAPQLVQAQDIIETATAAGNFKTFLKALNEAGLNETLKGPGPFTVLAPSDEAFAKLPKDKLEALLKDKTALRNVLLYHVIAGKLTAADFAKINGKSRKTIEGGDAMVMMMGSQVMIGSATIVKADIMAKNGVIHIVDTVMIPPGR